MLFLSFFLFDISKKLKICLFFFVKKIRAKSFFLV